MNLLDREIEARNDNAWRARVVPDAEVNGTPSGRAGALIQPLELWPEAVDGDELLHDLVAALSRYVVLPEGAAVAIVLWILHAHAHDAARFSPILTLQSPEMRCGKTTALEVIQALVPRPLFTSNISAPALFRAVTEYMPTLILDEADTFLPNSKDLRSVLNSGHRRVSARVVRADRGETRVFSTWCPKVIALIGAMPSTLTDRSLLIRLQRKRPDERVEPLSPESVAALNKFARKLARWTRDNLAAVQKANPVMPGLTNREADNWHPLLAIADTVGGKWSERARRTACLLSPASDDEAGDAVKLLVDIQAVFDEKGTDKIYTTDLIEGLIVREGRGWAEYRLGRPITPHQVAALLDPFGIKPKPVRIGETVLRGYRSDDFEDSWSRYAPTKSVTPLQATKSEDLGDARLVPEMPASQPNSLTGKDCNGVTDPGTAPAVGGVAVAREASALDQLRASRPLGSPSAGTAKGEAPDNDSGVHAELATPRSAWAAIRALTIGILRRRFLTPVTRTTKINRRYSEDRGRIIQ